jgi:DNA ligase (NAD+)
MSLIYHNQDFINELHIGIGDTIIVYKSGEVIPKIKGSISEKRPKGVHDFVLPEKCPFCGSLTIREEGSADVKCINPLCPAQKLRKIINFVERDSMDIKGLGYEVINKLIQFNYINTIPDLYNLKDKRNELISSGVVGREKAVDNLLAAIEKSKGNEPWRVVAGLGISQVGKTLGKQMMGEYFSSIDEIADSSVMKLSQIPNVGIITAKAIYNFFHSEAGSELIGKLKVSGVNMENRNEAKASDELSGLTFVITGDVHVFKNRNELTDFIEAHGGKCSGSVSKKTEALINNDSASQSSKNIKANELGIKILTEEAFLKNYNLSK